MKLRQIGTLILLLAAFLLLGARFCGDWAVFKNIRDAQNRLGNESTEAAIRESASLKELDNVCSQIPLPKDFTLIEKGGLDDQKVTLSYLYNSNLKEYDVVIFFIRHLKEDEWQLIKDSSMDYPPSLEFKKNNIRLVMQNGGMGKNVVSINCERLPVH